MGQRRWKIITGYQWWRREYCGTETSTAARGGVDSEGERRQQLWANRTRARQTGGCAPRLRSAEVNDRTTVEHDPTASTTSASVRDARPGTTQMMTKSSTIPSNNPGGDDVVQMCSQSHPTCLRAGTRERGGEGGGIATSRRRPRGAYEPSKALATRRADQRNHTSHCATGRSSAQGWRQDSRGNNDGTRVVW